MRPKTVTVENFQTLVVTNGDTFDIESPFFNERDVKITWCEYKHLSSYISNTFYHSIIFSAEVDSIMINKAIDTVNDLDNRCLYLALLSQKKLDQVERYLQSAVDCVVLFPIKNDGLDAILYKHYKTFLFQKEMYQSQHALKMYKYAIDQSFIFAKTNLLGEITEVNNAFCTITGYEKDEIVGKNFSILHHPDTSKEKIKELWTTIQAKKVYKNRIYNRTKLDDDIIFDSVIVPIFDYEEEIQEYICFLKDLTDVVGLNVYLKNEQSMHEKKLKDVKDSYLQIFSHELKTPLNAIINFSQYVEKKVFKDEITHKEKLIHPLQNIRQCGYEISDMIHSFILLTKIKDKKIDVNLTMVSLEETVSVLLQKYSLSINQENIDVEVVVDSHTLVQTDEKLLTTVLEAIISNAIKYGNKRIRITIAIDKTSFMVSIEDNGPGVKNKESAFDLFEQGDKDTMTRTGKGAGVGLHLCDLLADMLELHLDIEASLSLGGTNMIVVGNNKHSKGEK